MENTGFGTAATVSVGILRRLTPQPHGHSIFLNSSFDHISLSGLSKLSRAQLLPLRPWVFL